MDDISNFLFKFARSAKGLLKLMLFALYVKKATNLNLNTTKFWVKCQTIFSQYRIRGAKRIILYSGTAQIYQEKDDHQRWRCWSVFVDPSHPPPQPPLDQFSGIFADLADIVVIYNLTTVQTDKHTLPVVDFRAEIWDARPCNCASLGTLDAVNAPSGSA